MNRFQAAVERLFRSLGYCIVPAWRYAPNTLETHLKVLFDVRKVSCVIDVGANIGQYYDLLRNSVGYKGWIVSFEPVSDNFRQLQRKAAVDPYWRIVQCALGARNSETEINVMRDTQLSSLLTPDDSQVKQYVRENEVMYREKVSVRTLEDAFHEVARDGTPTSRCYLKIDTQGYDLEVLEGAKAVLDRVVAMQMELAVKAIYHGVPSLGAALERARDLGFEVTGMFPVARDNALRLIEMDCTFTRAHD